MDDFKLKLVITVLSGIVFSFIFIILAFVLPEKKEEAYAKPSNLLQEVSHALRD
ncbi:MAG: hypothetical protein QG559_649 [Campylobacterota bacterium]|nr:hypothetical protein [Campylobacterota bacterium]